MIFLGGNYMFNLFKTSHLYRNTEDEWNYFRSGTDAIIYYNTNHIEFDQNKHIVRVFVKYYTNNGPQMKIYLDPEHAQRTLFGSMLIDIEKKLCRLDEAFLQGADHSYFSEKNVPWHPINYVEEPLFVYCRNLMNSAVVIPPEDTEWIPFLENDIETGQYALFKSNPIIKSDLMIMYMKNKFQPIHRYIAFSFVRPEIISTNAFQITPYAETIVTNDRCSSTFYLTDINECSTFAENIKTFPITTAKSIQEFENFKACANSLLFEFFSNY